MTFNLYLDEDSMAASLVRRLRVNGFDLVTTREAARIRRRDADQLEYAAATGRVLYTANVGDFARLHAQYESRGQSHSGIIVRNHQRLSVERQLHCLLRIRGTFEADGMANTIIFLENYL